MFLVRIRAYKDELRNEESVNEAGRRGCCPVHFKDLRTTIALRRAWVRRRVAVGIPTAISVAKENAGRKTGSQVSVLRRPPISDHGASRVASSFQRPRALTLRKTWRRSADGAREPRCA